MVCQSCLAVRATPGRLSNSATRRTTSSETTAVAGVSGASCAVCRNHNKRMAIGVKSASNFQRASMVCRKRSSMPQPVLRTAVKVLQEPAPFVPCDALPSLFGAVYGYCGDQQPFQRLASRRWLRFPHMQDPGRDCCLIFFRCVRGWLETDLLPTNLDKGLACWTLMLGRNLQDSTILSGKRASQGFEMIAGWII